MSISVTPSLPLLFLFLSFCLSFLVSFGLVCTSACLCLSFLSLWKVSAFWMIKLKVILCFLTVYWKMYQIFPRKAMDQGRETAYGCLCFLTSTIRVCTRQSSASLIWFPWCRLGSWVGWFSMTLKVSLISSTVLCWSNCLYVHSFSVTYFDVGIYTLLMLAFWSLVPVKFLIPIDLFNQLSSANWPSCIQ